MSELYTAPNSLLLNERFGRDSQALGYCVSGWSHPEANLIWSLSPGCVLVIPTNETVPTAVLLEVSPAIAPPRFAHRIMWASVNGGPEITIQASHRGLYYLPCRYHKLEGRIQIVFRFDQAVEGIPNERRPLAFAFHSVRLISESDTFEFVPFRLPSIELPRANEEAIVSVGRLVGRSPDDFLMGFESLGHTCDFGVFQRTCGAEPLGLLRFGVIATHRLVDGLLDRFTELAEPSRLEVIEAELWGGEYMLIDHSYGIMLHTALRPGQAAPEQIIARERWRLPYLRRLFLEVVDEGLKVFVLRRADAMDVHEALAVAAILRLFGDNMLLWATQETSSETGSVDVLRPYFFQGHLDVEHNRGTATLRAWLSICANTYTIARR